MYPQSGVITSLDRRSGLGKALIPLFQFETEWCQIAKNLINDESLQNGCEVLVVFLNGDVHSPTIAAVL